MRLNTLKPGHGSKRPRLRVGRGASAGQGKTCGRGVKGQRARKGGYHKVGFEGGQTPLDRRLPKFGFRSDIAVTRAEVRLHELEKIEGGVVDLESQLLAVAQLAGGRASMLATIRSKGARAAIEAAGGTIEAPQVKAEDEPKARDPVKRAAAEAKIKAKAEADEKAKADAKAGKASAKAAKAAKDQAEPKGTA